MKLWKYDWKAGTVRCVEGELYPGKDADGDTCYIGGYGVHDCVKGVKR